MVTSSASVPDDTVRPVLLWEHGAAASDYPFSSVGLGVVRDDSVVVVAAARNRELVGIEPGGDDHVVLARGGQGPSEVGGPRQIVAGPGNEVWVEDVLNVKLMRFEGDSLAEVMGSTAIPWERASLMPIGVDAAGRLLVTTASYDPSFEEPWLQAALAVFDVSGSVVDTVGFFDYVPRTGDAPTSPWGAYGVVSVAGGRFVTARIDQPRVTWRSPDGPVAQVFAWEQPRDYPDAEDWAAFRASLRERWARPGQSETDLDVRVDDMLSDYVLDATQALPLFHTILGTESGDVWIAPFTPRQAATADGWRVAARDGGWRGFVEFARPIRILHVSDDLIVGVHTDEMDVQTIAVYGNPFGRQGRDGTP